MQHDFEIIQQLEKLLNLGAFTRGSVRLEHSPSGRIQSVSVIAVTAGYDRLDPALRKLFVPDVEKHCGPCKEFAELLESLGNAT